MSRAISEGSGISLLIVSAGSRTWASGADLGSVLPGLVASGFCHGAKWYDARVMTKLSLLAIAALAGTGCTPKVPPHPALGPITAERILHYDNKAQNRLKEIKSQDPTCDFKLQLPDQSTHPDSVEVDHVVSCNGRNDLKQFDANAEFTWNKERGQWELTHFGG